MTLQEFNEKLDSLRVKSGMREDVFWPIVYDEDEIGEILIDGIPLTGENLSGWHQSLGYIPQEPLILNASVRENLLRFQPNATEADTVEVLRKA